MNVIHGGVTEAELAAARARGVDLVDLSASLNPYGPHPAVVEAAQQAVVSRYPEPDAATLRAAYAERHGLEPNQVLAGNGSTELLYLLARAFPGPGLIVGPTFGEYRAACEAAGSQVRTLTCEPPGLRHQAGAVARAIVEFRPGLAFVCNPNNPTGQLWTRADIEAMRLATLKCGGTLLVDEAYLDFACGADELRTPLGPGVLVLRSLTKLHAIPGLRLGFLLGDDQAIARVARQQPSWSVNAAAAAAGLAALELTDWEDECLRRIAGTRAQLLRELRAGSFHVLDSGGNFLLVEVGDGANFRSRMVERGWVLRDCASFGLPRHIRVAMPRDEQAPALLSAFKECLV